MKTLLLFLLTTCPLLGLQNGSWATLSQVRFTRLDEKQNLVHNHIRSIVQDQNGYLWFGTNNGLNRYDGEHFLRFRKDPNQKNTLKNDDINCMAVGAYGFLWLGTWGGGLHSLDPTTGLFQYFSHDPLNPQSISSNFIQCILEDGEYLWVGTYDGGLAHLNKTTGVATHLKELSQRRILSLFKDGTSLYIGTSRGLYIYDLDRNDLYEKLIYVQGEVLAQPRVNQLLKDERGQFWIATGNGLLRGNGEEFQKVHPTEGEKFGWVDRLLQDHRGHIWWGSDQDGLHVYDGHQIYHFKNDPGRYDSLSSNFVTALFEDLSGNLWIGTGDHGLNRLNLKPNKFERYIYQPQDSFLIDGEIRAIAHEKDRILWIGSGIAGCARINFDTKETITYRKQEGNPNSLTNDSVNAILVGPKGNTWVGTKNGLNKITPQGTITQYLTQNHPGLLDNHIHSLLFDHKGLLWIGNQRGLSRFDGERFIGDSHNPDVRGSLGKGGVYSILEDEDQKIWLGLGEAGLYYYDGKHNQFYPQIPAQAKKQLSDQRVYAIHSNAQYLWIGTASGLNQLNKETSEVTWFGEQEGLPSNAIYAILADKSNHLWLATSNGISRFNTNDYSVHNYDTFDELQSNQFAVGSCAITDQGEFFFGGLEGINSFYPEQNIHSQYQAPIVISQIKIRGVIYDQEIATNILYLEPEENFVAFTFASLDYTNPQKNRYRYILEGLQLEWIEAGTNNTASYTDLDPGTYEFRVRATNSDGVWVDETEKMILVISEPLYLSWWAFLFYFLLGTTIISAALQIQKRRLAIKGELRFLAESEKFAVDANKAKSAFLANMSHELLTPLNAIIGYSEILEEDLHEDEIDPEQALSDLQKVRSAAYYQLSIVNNLLELTKLESGNKETFIETVDPQKLIDTIVNQTAITIEKAGNHLIASPGKEQLKPMKTDLVKLQCILINLLSNANKFTEKGSITLSVRQFMRDQRHWTVFRVKDEGIGLPPDQLNKLQQTFESPIVPRHSSSLGIGLFLCKNFAEMLNGCIEVISDENKGSTFLIVLPTEQPQGEHP